MKVLYVYLITDTGRAPQRAGLRGSSLRLVGVGGLFALVSELDVFSRKGETAKDIMSPNVISITEDTTIVEAAALLAGERIRRLPVLASGRLVGLISRSDVLDFFAQSHWTCETCANSVHGPCRAGHRRQPERPHETNHRERQAAEDDPRQSQPHGPDHV